MKHRSLLVHALRTLICVISFVGLVLPLAATSAAIALTTIPLSTATTTTVKPNMMFVLDNSGSMNWDYLPDLVVDGNYCKGNTSTGTGSRCCINSNNKALSSSNVSSTCLPSEDQTDLRGMPPFYSSDFNKNYYDPTITYAVPLNYDGTEKTSYSGATAVPLDGYGKQSTITTTLNLKTSYPDVEWCTNTNYDTCMRNDNYLLPGTVNSISYTKMHATTASGSKSFATGTVAAPTATTSTAGPFYYVMVPGEYCTDATLTDCAAATTATTSRPIAAKLRWCKTTALSTCQATQNSTYKYPRYPTIINSDNATVPGAFKRIDIISGQSYGNLVIDGQIVINRANRLDCAARPVCTYDEELKNFANWFAWYRTRMQMMKTSVSRAYKDIDNRYRVGFFTINSQTSNYLKIDTFNAGSTGQKKLWYDKLFNADPSGGTPLRSSLAKVGRIFPAKIH